MFHTLITLAYIIPNIYVFIRIWQLFIKKGYRRYYAFFYILIALIYPVSNLIPEDRLGFLALIFEMITNYLLPFYLYLFIFVLLFDILLLVNYLFKLIPKGKINELHFRKVALSVILSLPVLVVVAGIINFNTIRKSDYRIAIPRGKSKLESLRIVFVADFHLKKGTNVHFVERFVREISAIRPDLLLYGGDIVEGESEEGDLVINEALLRELKPEYGVFTVLGNHEHYGGNDYGRFFENAGIKVLCDTVVVIDSSFNLAGRFDPHIRGRKNIDDLMNSVTDSLPVILIDHRPSEIEQVSRSGIDVQLSGHTHHGQMFPINLITKNIYLLSWGYRKIGKTNFFVTSGIRLWGPPVRTTGKSEIMVIDITFI
jgi:predicted MPP superfamily phosphohydrolase